MRDGYLQVISGSRVGQKLRIVDRVELGRSPENTLSFGGPDGGLVSGRHAVIEWVGDDLVLRDLNSRNGTYVNGVRVDEHLLRPNEVVSLGLGGPKLRVQGETSAPGLGMPLRPGLRYDGKPVTRGGPPPEGRAAPGRERAAGAPEPPPPGGVSTGRDAPRNTAAAALDAGGYTMGLAHRLRNDEADPDELGELFRNGARVKRLVGSGALASREARMIASAAETFSTVRRKGRLVAAVIASAAAVVISVLAVQNLGYRKRLAEQENLIATIGELESRLKDYRSPETARPDEDKGLLVARLRAAERQLMNLRSHIRSKDLVSTYKNPLGREIHLILEGFGKQNYIVPDIFIKQVERHIRTFTRPPVRRIIEKALANKRIHYELIESELLKAGMPLAFFYLAMHESSLDSAIVSRAGARGLWQFMPGTARRFGLRVPADWRTQPPQGDQRTHPLLSTRAAIRYLKILYAEFGDVALAMAAYNAGEGRVRGALRRIDDPINNRDFWYIYRMGFLADETNEYMPKIIATMIIDKNRQRYGFPP